jgi:glycerol dehydrogenase
LPSYTKGYGRYYFIIDAFFFEDLSAKLTGLYQGTGKELRFEMFEGQITPEKVESSAAKVREADADIVIGIGGGKTLDLAKAAAFKAGDITVVVSPTTASNDAPCSACSVLYEESGTEIGPLLLKSNPDMVIVDSAIIAKAPVRFLAAGIGDALATWYEALANVSAGRANYIRCGDVDGYRHTALGMAAARSCAEIIFSDAAEAVRDAREGKLTEALENVIEANVLLSGVGFENMACAGAHSISIGLGAIPGKAMLHGEKVAYGILVQLQIENAPADEIRKLMDLYTQIGLPLTLEELGVNGDADTIRMIAAASFPGEWEGEPTPLDTDAVAEAIISAEKLSCAYLHSNR